MMTKSLEVDGYKGLCICLLRDMHGLVLTTEDELERDCARALTLIENRGLGFLTLTLPEVGKIFDRSLASGSLLPIRLPGFRLGSGRSSTYPEFLQGMWKKVFDSNGLLRPEPCVLSIAMLRQFFYCFKKVRLNCDPSRIADTIREFYEVDSSLRLPSHFWDGADADDCPSFALHLSDGANAEQGDQPDLIEGFLSHSVRPSVVDYVQHTADVVVSSFDGFTAEDWKPKHGPGAVSDGKLGAFSKYTFPNWSARLETVFPQAVLAFANYSLWVDWVNHGVGYPSSSFEDKEVPSRLIAVPKTMKGPRLIAAEPTSSQYCQQVVLSYLVRQVNRGLLQAAIEFNSQEPNRQLALSASLTGDQATIDLSSASDCVSCWLVERIFRSHRPLLEALKASRTPWLRDDISHRGLTYLRKFTTMGAATTFPVQSIIYAIIAIAVIMHEEGLLPLPNVIRDVAGRVQVFGDDIIIPNKYAAPFIEVLMYLGFKVNQTKTFTEGNFRESCGMDAYAGVDVTPAYVLELYEESRPTSLESVRQCSNNFFNKGLWRTAEYLQKTLPDRILRSLPVVASGSGATGLESFCGPSYGHLKKRWNVELQRNERRVVGIDTPQTRRQPDGSANLLQYFEEAPNPDTMITWQSGYDERPGALVRNRWVDEAALGKPRVPSTTD